MIPLSVIAILVIVSAVSYTAIEYGEVIKSDITNYAPDVSPLEIANSAKQLFEEKITKFPDGMEISNVYQVQKTMEDANPSDPSLLGFQNPFSPQQHETVPVNYTAEQVAQLQPVEQDTVTNPIETYVIGYKPFPTIQGYIKIKDKATGEYVKPFIYKSMITISCKSSMEFCALMTCRRWVKTQDGGKDADGNDLGGFYYYVWMPSQPTDIYEGLYDVCIQVSSLEKNNFGIYPTNKHCYQIRMTH